MPSTRPTTLHLVPLLERYRTGDQIAFLCLDRASRPRLRKWLYRRLPNAQLRGECEDAAQIALFKLSRGSETFPDDQELLAWLRTTAKNAALNAHRRRRPRADSMLVCVASGAVE